MSTTTMPMGQTRVHIRWMIRRDMPEVLAIESASSDQPWTEEEFLRVLRQRNCIGMVAESGDRVVGYMIYELHKYRLEILDFAVDPEFRRRGIGTQMTDKLKGKLSTHRRTRILLHARETNLNAHLFLRDNLFEAVEVIRDYFEDTCEDSYVFQFVIPKVELSGQRRIDNRIASQIES